MWGWTVVSDLMLGGVDPWLLRPLTPAPHAPHVCLCAFYLHYRVQLAPSTFSFAPASCTLRPAPSWHACVPPPCPLHSPLTLCPCALPPAPLLHLHRVGMDTEFHAPMPCSMCHLPLVYAPALCTLHVHPTTPIRFLYAGWALTLRSRPRLQSRPPSLAPSPSSRVLTWHATRAMTWQTSLGWVSFSCASTPALNSAVLFSYYRPHLLCLNCSAFVIVW